MKRKRIMRCGSFLCALLLLFSLNGGAFAETETPHAELATAAPEPAASEETVLSQTDQTLDPPGQTNQESGNKDVEDAPAADGESPEGETAEEDHAGNGNLRKGETAAIALMGTSGATDGFNSMSADPPASDGGAVLTSAPASGGESAGTTQTDPLLVIGGTELDFTQAASGDGWSYVCDENGGYVALEGYSGADQIVGTAGSDLTIKNSGLNHVGTLIVDGNLNLIGSGILLVDNMELASGADFNLLTNTSIYRDGTGSVAVFVRREDTTNDEEGKPISNVYYELLNRTVSGILDEDCVIPAGVTLKIPAQGSLVMQSVTVYETGEYLYQAPPEGVDTTTQTVYNLDPVQEFELNVIATSIDNTICSSPVTTAPQLTISGTAQLIVDAAASITCNAIKQTITWDTIQDTYVSVRNYIPSILVQGKLSLEGATQDMIHNAIIRRDIGGECDDTIVNCVVQIRENEEDSWPDDKTVEVRTPGTGSAGGGSTVTTTTTQTGNAKLGQNAGSITGSGEGKSILTGSGITNPISRKQSGPAESDTGSTGAGDQTWNVQGKPAAKDGQTAEIWVDEKEEEDTYVLHMKEDGREIIQLHGMVSVRMGYTHKAGDAGKKLYVVFRDRSGKLQAFAAQYDAETQELLFETNRLGRFVVVAFLFPGEEFSPEFYTALAKLEEVEKLS